MTTLFVEQLTVIDFSYFDPDRGIVGESWILDVELDGSLDDNGMVFDFTHVKKQIKQYYPIYKKAPVRRLFEPEASSTF